MRSTVFYGFQRWSRRFQSISGVFHEVSGDLQKLSRGVSQMAPEELQGILEMFLEVSETLKRFSVNLKGVTGCLDDSLGLQEVSGAFQRCSRVLRGFQTHLVDLRELQKRSTGFHKVLEAFLGRSRGFQVVFIGSHEHQEVSGAHCRMSGAF